MKILIIDDDKEFVKEFGKYIRVNKIEAGIKTASGAKEALDILSGEKIDIVLLNLKLSGMSGFEFLNLFKTNFTKIPVIIISSEYAEPADRVCALWSGARTFFSKPVRPELVWQDISYIMNGVLIGR